MKEMKLRNHNNKEKLNHGKRNIKLVTIIVIIGILIVLCNESLAFFNFASFNKVSKSTETVFKENLAKIDNINFVLEILKYYQNRSGNTSTLEFQRYLDKLLNTSPSSDCVTLSSVHKAKGLEADNVFVLNEGKVCFDPRNSPELQQQEKNLSYISLTRAKNKMYLVKEPSAQNTKRG